MKVSLDYVFDEISSGLTRALPALMMAMFMMIIASLQPEDAEQVAAFAAGSSICFAALSAILIWGPMDKNRRSFWQIWAVVFFATGFALFIITIIGFYYETFFG